MDKRGFSGQVSARRSPVAGVTLIDLDTAHHFPRHTHDHYGIGILRRGAQRSASGRGGVEAAAGDVITVNPGEVHDGVPLTEGGRRWSMLYLSPAVVGAGLSDLSEHRVTEAELPDPVLRNPALGRLLAAAIRRLDAGALAPLAGESTLLILLSRAFRLGPGAQRPCADGTAIRDAKALIDDDPADPVTLERLAQVTGLSRFQVIRGFTKSVGLTPHAYLVQRRLDLARSLIGAGTALSEAAAASGFADQSHMTRIFKARYGLSPGAFARLNAGG